GDEKPERRDRQCVLHRRSYRNAVACGIRRIEGRRAPAHPDGRAPCRAETLQHPLQLRTSRSGSHRYGRCINGHVWRRCRKRLGQHRRPCPREQAERATRYRQRHSVSRIRRSTPCYRRATRDRRRNNGHLESRTTRKIKCASITTTFAISSPRFSSPPAAARTKPPSSPIISCSPTCQVTTATA